MKWERHRAFEQSVSVRRQFGCTVNLCHIKGLNKGWIRPRETPGRDWQAVALKELHADCALLLIWEDFVVFALLLFFFALSLVVRVGDFLIHLISYLFICNTFFSPFFLPLLLSFVSVLWETLRSISNPSYFETNFWTQLLRVIFGSYVCTPNSLDLFLLDFAIRFLRNALHTVSCLIHYWWFPHYPWVMEVDASNRS